MDLQSFTISYTVPNHNAQNRSKNNIPWQRNVWVFVWGEFIAVRMGWVCHRTGGWVASQQTATKTAILSGTDGNSSLYRMKKNLPLDPSFSHTSHTSSSSSSSVLLLLLHHHCHRCHHHHHRRFCFCFPFSYSSVTLFIIIGFEIGERRHSFCEKNCMCIEYEKTPVETDTYRTYHTHSSSVGWLLCSWSRSNINRGAGVGVTSSVLKNNTAPPVSLGKLLFFTFLSHELHIIDLI